MAALYSKVVSKVVDVGPVSSCVAFCPSVFERDSYAKFTLDSLGKKASSFGYKLFPEFWTCNAAVLGTALLFFSTQDTTGAGKTHRDCRQNSGAR